MITRQQAIYSVLFTKRYDELMREHAKSHRARRLANIYAVRWTTKVWQREQRGLLTNLFNCESW